MKNIDKIRKMSAEELAKWKNKPCPCRCEFNKTCDMACKGLIEWLYQEANPMPEIKRGDIFVYLRGQIPFFGVCIYGNIVYLPDKGKCLNFGGEIKENTVTIKRYDSAKGTMEEIWGADNE